MRSGWERPLRRDWLLPSCARKVPRHASFSIVPEPLLGQWQDELYRLFGIQAVEGRLESPVAVMRKEGVFPWVREAAGSERGVRRFCAMPTRLTFA